MAFHKELI